MEKIDLDEEWLSARNVLQALRSVLGPHVQDGGTVVDWAANGLVVARASVRIVFENGQEIDRHAGQPLSKEFWTVIKAGRKHAWMAGSALPEWNQQEWGLGQFIAYFRNGDGRREEAFGVQFFRSDLEKMLGISVISPSHSEGQSVLNDPSKAIPQDRQTDKTQNSPSLDGANSPLTRPDSEKCKELARKFDIEGVSVRSVSASMIAERWGADDGPTPKKEAITSLMEGQKKGRRSQTR